MKKHPRIMVILVTVAVIAIAAILIIPKLTESSQEAPSVPTPEPQRLIGFVSGDEQSLHTALIRDAFETAAGQQGWDVIVSDAQGKRDMALMHGRTFIDQQVGQLVVYNLDDEISQVLVKEADDAGIPILVVDGVVEDAACYTINNESIGRLAGQALLDALDATSSANTTLLIAKDDSLSANTLKQMDFGVGFIKEALSLDDERITEINCYHTRQNAYDRIKEQAQALPEGEKLMILCVRDEYAVGALQAVEELGLSGRAAIVSIGGTTDAVLNMQKEEANAWVGSVALKEEAYGEHMVEMLQNDSKEVRYAEHQLITHDNVQNLE